MKSCDLFIVTGEASGDRLGADLLTALFEKQPHLQVSAIAGPLMRAHPIDCLFPMEELQVMGFIDVLLALPRLRRLFYTALETIERLQPRLVITIDYPGFNLRLAQHLKKRGFQGKLVHYVCPSVWAWGKKRIPIMARTLDLLLSILPFESKLFAKTSLRTLFIGNPIAERLRRHRYATRVAPDPFIALFPGSRAHEIQRNLPLMLRACKVAPDLPVALSIANPKLIPLIQQVLEKEQWDADKLIWVQPDCTYELMKQAHLAIAKSGTVTLELALHHTPTVVIYAISKLDYFIAYYLLRIRLPFYALPNLIAEKQIFAELIGPHLTQNRLNAAVKALLDPHTRSAIQAQCQELDRQLSNKTPSEEAARAVLHFLT
jgi:lipid-A-disaccharide synthase